MVDVMSMPSALTMERAMQSSVFARQDTLTSAQHPTSLAKVRCFPPFLSIDAGER